jgi:Na+/H+-dicarboxylate symporter
MIAIPIILSSLITGVASLKDLTKLGRIGGKTILLFLFTATIATSMGITLAGFIKPGEGISSEIRTNLSKQFGSTAEVTVSRAHEYHNAGPLKIIQDMVPDNIIKAASDNTLMIQVVFFAVLIGIAIIKVKDNKASSVLNFFESLNEILMKLVSMIMNFAPYGVFALIASVLAAIGGDISGFLIELGKYCLTVLVALVLMLFVVYPAIFLIFSDISYKQFFKGMQPALLLGFSSSSSSATLPVTLERVEKHLGVPEYITRFVLPFGTTINMDGTAIYQSVAAVFAAQALGIDLTFGQMITVILTAIVSAAGAAGIPGAGMVTLVIVLESIGIPSMAGIVLITAPDRLLDMCRTVVNVAGDAVAAVVIAKSESSTGSSNSNS